VNENKPLMTHRKSEGAVRTVGVKFSREELGGAICKPTQRQPGVKAARSQFIGCSVERGNSGLWRLREMTSGEDRRSRRRSRRRAEASGSEDHARLSVRLYRQWSGTKRERHRPDGDWQRIPSGSGTTLAARREQLGREINPTVYSVTEFNRKRASKDHFLSQV